jgi:phage terminase large subunit
MARSRATVDLRFNGPQFASYGWLFDEKGEVRRRRTVMLPWGRGVGKSWYRRQIWWTLVAQLDGKKRKDSLKPLKGVRITSMMPTLKQFKDVHGGDIETELAPDGPWGFLRGKYDRASGQIRFPGGSWVKPFPATAHNARTSRGMRTDVLDADELDDIDPAVYDAIATPWLSEPWSLGIELPGGTPTRGRHGLWWRTLQATKLAARLRRGEVSEATALESPAAIAIRGVFEELSVDEWPTGLPPDPAAATIAVLKNYYGRHSTYRDAPETVSPLAVARARATTPPATFAREWEADADAGEGLVYPFDERFHVREPPKNLRFREFVVGQDHGWSDPGVQVRGGVQGHGEDAVLWLLDEHYDRETPNHVWDERARKWGDAVFWPDPSRPDRIHDLRMLGIHVGETDNDIFAGLSRVANLLFIRDEEDGTRWARLYVSPKCVNTIREFGLYRRKKNPDGSFDEMPEDKNNHAMDAVRYMAVGRFGRMPNVRHSASGR